MWDKTVSIIMPTYNSEKYISEAIESVINQTYTKWELIIVDDNSRDNTERIVMEVINKYEDKEIKYFKLKENRGAAYARNLAIKNSIGRFLAFLDSDDIWSVNKLEYQIKYMLENKCVISHSNYEVISDDGESKGKVVKVPEKINYNKYLRNTIIQTLTVMIDRKYINDVKMIDIRMRQDFVTWLSILKKGHEAYGINEVLGKYRRTKNSLSSNKIKAMRYNWYVYREIEDLGVLKSIYVFSSYLITSTIKRLII